MTDCNLTGLPEQIIIWSISGLALTAFVGVTMAVILFIRNEFF